MDYFYTYLFSFFIVFNTVGCGGNSDNNNAERLVCNVDKINLLLRDIMSKRFFYKNIKPVGEDNIPYRNILYLRNIPIRDSVFYWKINDRNNPDSIKINLFTDTINQYEHTNAFGIVLKKTNWDTTDVELNVDYGQNRMALKWTTYQYIFDYNNCKWIVKDSVYNEY